LRLKTPWRDRTSHILMERSELIERLVLLIPPPRAHQVRYHGILAPCASWRYRVVPAGNAALAAPAGDRPLMTPWDRQTYPTFLLCREPDISTLR